MKSLIKKIVVIFGIIATMSISLNITNPQSVSAYDSALGSCRDFIGMTSWDCNVIEKPSNDEELKQNIWTIAANVATDITVIAAYLVLGYVIYGGYLYMFSGGDPGKVATGKKALSQAFIGLAIVMFANIILNTIRITLNVNFNSNCIDSNCGTDPATMISSVLQWAIAMGGLVAVIFIIYGGISYTTSSGDPNKVKKAKDIILYSLIGLAIVVLAEAIVIFVSNMLIDANENAYINTTTTSIIKQNINGELL